MPRNSMKFELDLKGLDLGRWLKDFNPATQQRILTDAVSTAARPIVQDAKANAPKRTGALRRSLGFIIRRYPKTGNIVAVIGARDGTYIEKNNARGRKVLRSAGPTDSRVIRPAKYAHLVEFGHRSVHGGGRPLEGRSDTGKGVWNSVNKGRSLRHGTIGATSFIPPRPFLRPAFEKNKARALEALSFGFFKALQSETRRVASKINRKIKHLVAA